MCKLRGQGLPSHFCNNNLPRNDGTLTLVDEEGEEYPTVYLARKVGLSGGWRGFSIEHGLVDGDALVFQLIQPTKFKVINSKQVLLFVFSSSYYYAFLFKCSFFLQLQY